MTRPDLHSADVVICVGDQARLFQDGGAEPEPVAQEPPDVLADVERSVDVAELDRVVLCLVAVGDRTCDLCGAGGLTTEQFIDAVAEEL